MKIIYAAILMLVLQMNLQADIVLFEDFEDGALTYTTNVADDLSDIANSDYFGRISPGTATPPVDISYLNVQGTGYYSAHDTDGTPSGNIDLITLNWTGINITDFDNLNLSWFVAEDNATDGNEDWDTSSSVRIEFQIDGGGFQDLFAIESELGFDGNETNELPRVDTNFDGTGDGAEITDVFTQYSSAIANGSVLDIRLTIEDLDSGDEDIAFDNLLLQGDFVGIPEPSSCGLLALGLGLVGYRRRRHR